ncbi:hypothetical protein BS50DRAFT_609977 [Corynespora cassiicola Philippines]|uniref:Uncharacterized protein n=1 Tax=Corynespora cassiicola Philippines TaxID=1448308 RepID=A0A2T2NSI1_CORCC|nr:hypothetical protein BS50DRAFT_609977 [Corynespora cassiicola Philippines]
MAASTMQSSPFANARYSSDILHIGAGVAIFHLASERIIMRSKKYSNIRLYYFLLKGMRDAGEESEAPVVSPLLTAEPLWMRLVTIRQKTIQYAAFFYIAETLPPDLDEEPLESHAGRPLFKAPPPYPDDLFLRDRVKMEPEGYEPKHHQNTGVNDEEQSYQSYLVPISRAVELLGKDDVRSHVILRGWEAIKARYTMEKVVDTVSQEQIATASRKHSNSI